jgi:hypothetical protein
MLIWAGEISDKIMEIRGTKRTSNPAASCVSQSLQPVSAETSNARPLSRISCREVSGIPSVKLRDCLDELHGDVRSFLTLSATRFQRIVILLCINLLQPDRSMLLVVIVKVPNIVNLP